MFNIQLKIQMFIYWYKGIQVFGISYLWRRCCTKTYSGGVNWCCSVAKSCPSLCNSMDYSTPGSSALHSLWVCSKSCPLSQWCYLTISSSAAPFSFCLQCLPASSSFAVSWLFTLGGQSIVGVSASVLPMNIALPLIQWMIIWESGAWLHFFFELCISTLTGGFWSSLMLRALVCPRSHETGELMTGWSRDTWSLARVAPASSRFGHKDNTLFGTSHKVYWALRLASQSRVIHHAA